MAGEMNRDQACDQALRGGADDENRTRTKSLGMSAGSTVTSIIAGRRLEHLSVSIRQRS